MSNVYNITAIACLVKSNSIVFGYKNRIVKIFETSKFKKVEKMKMEKQNHKYCVNWFNIFVISDIKGNIIVFDTLTQLLWTLKTHFKKKDQLIIEKKNRKLITTGKNLENRIYNLIPLHKSKNPILEKPFSVFGKVKAMINDPQTHVLIFSQNEQIVIYILPKS